MNENRNFLCFVYALIILYIVFSFLIHSAYSVNSVRVCESVNECEISIFFLLFVLILRFTHNLAINISCISIRHQTIERKKEIFEWNGFFFYSNSTTLNIIISIRSQKDKHILFRQFFFSLFSFLLLK